MKKLLHFVGQICSIAAAYIYGFAVPSLIQQGHDVKATVALLFFAFFVQTAIRGMITEAMEDRKKP